MKSNCWRSAGRLSKIVALSSWLAQEAPTEAIFTIYLFRTKPRAVLIPRRALRFNKPFKTNLPRPRCSASLTVLTPSVRLFKTPELSWLIHSTSPLLYLRCSPVNKLLWLPTDFPLPHYAFFRLEVCEIEERTIVPRQIAQSEVLDHVCVWMPEGAPPQRSCDGGISDARVVPEDLRASGVAQEKKRLLYMGYRKRVGSMCGDLDSLFIWVLCGNVSVSIFVFRSRHFNQSMFSHSG